jgi:RHS repeat-associated protein
VYEHIEYTPYGELWLEQANITHQTPFRFTGKELDKETGLYYYGARYLNPQTGMWLSADPAMGEYIPRAPIDDEAKRYNGNLPGMGGVYNYVNLHTYHYAGNNPVKLVDPDGREIDATFEITSYEKTDYGTTARGVLTITDKDTGETITAEAYSGGILSASDDTSLPLPLGEYEILDQGKRDGFYRLEPLDYNYGNDKADGLEPEQWTLRLHGPGATYGCLAVADRAKFNQIDNMLKRTSKSQAVVNYIGRIPFKKTETIIKFGNLTVVDNSPVPIKRIYEHPTIKLYPSVK